MTAPTRAARVAASARLPIQAGGPGSAPGLRSTPSSERSWFVDHDPFLPYCAERVFVSEVPRPHRVDSRYVELFWLPRVGPTALWALRRMAMRPPMAVRLDDLQAELGVQRQVLIRALGRLVHDSLVIPSTTSSTLYVHTDLPALRQGQVDRLGVHLRRMHRLYEANHVD